MHLNRSLLALFLTALPALGQYTWHSSTTSFPPPWTNLSAYPFGYQGYVVGGSNEGGEVRTQIIRTPTGVSYQWNYEHLLGWWSQTDYNTGQEHWNGYIVRFYENPPFYPLTATIYRRTSSGLVQLASFPMTSMPDGTILSTSWRAYDGPNGEGAGIHIRAGNQAIYWRSTTLPGNIGGMNGIGSSFPWSELFTDARVGALDQTPPNVVTGLNTSIANGMVSATWNASADNANGIGWVRYEIFRGSQSMGTTHQTNWTMPIAPGETFTFGVKPYDGHRSFRAATTSVVSAPPAVSGIVDDSRRVGVHSQSAQWGAMGESIDTRSMNLNYTIPLLKAQGRGGVGMGVSLSYNSQNWRKVDSTITKVGADVGYGFGWKLMAGSVIPIYSTPSTLDYYLFTDASGAEYKLDVNNNGVWRSKEGILVFYDANTYRLYFADGSFWRMESISASSEQDAGTRYPTIVQDRHGNQIVLVYRPAVGGSTPNQSARLQKIDDIRSTQASGWATYSFTYNTDAIPHLTGITNNINTAESYTLNYTAAQALFEPFGNAQQFGTSVRLASLVQNGVNLTTAFDYGTGAELAKVTLPLGGEFLWNYGTQSYASGRQMREVRSRDLRHTPGAALVNYAFSHPAGDASLKYHSETTLADPSGVGQRRWTYATTADFKQGLVAKYEELDNWTVKTRSENTWTDSGGGWPKHTETLVTMDVGQSFEKQQRTVHILSFFGQVRGRTVYPSSGS